jgi:hypothetical protein
VEKWYSKGILNVNPWGFLGENLGSILKEKNWEKGEVEVGASVGGEGGDVEEGCGGEEGEWGEEEQRRGEELKELKVVV